MLIVSTLDLAAVCNSKVILHHFMLQSRASPKKADMNMIDIKYNTCVSHITKRSWLLCRHPIYHGDAQLATEWFHKLGYTIPYLINAADFILDLASGDVSTKKVSGAESRLHLIACAERFLSVRHLPSCSCNGLECVC